MSPRRIFSRLPVCLAATLPLLALSHAASATPNIAMNSAVYVERTQTGNLRSLEPANRLARGERVVTVLNWQRLGGDGGFTITNPLPRTVAYQGSTNEGEEVSVDGGKSWGQLGALRIGTRMATPEDVTHVRWRISPNLARLGNGRVAYSGIVR